MFRPTSLLFLVGFALGADNIFDLEADDLLSGLPVPLSYYRGKVLLIVNVASQVITCHLCVSLMCNCSGIPESAHLPSLSSRRAFEEPLI
jgi:hypothetical protein